MSDLRKSILIVTYKIGKKKPEVFTSYGSMERAGLKRKMKTFTGDTICIINLTEGVLARSFAKRGFYEDENYYIYRANINR